VYSQDGLGLGHLRRTSALGLEFLRQHPGGSVLTIADSPMGTFLHDLPNHDYLKLPSIVKAGPGHWNALSLPLPFAEVRDLRRHLNRSAALGFNPDVLLVDHMPHGAMGELVDTLEALRGRQTRIVLGLRDIVDAPEVVRARWQIEGAFEAIERYYDEVLVYGSRDVFDLTGEYGWPDQLAARVSYCGYVCTPIAPKHPERVRSQLTAGRPGEKLIVAMAGGGADGYPLMRTLLEALPAIEAKQPSVLAMVTGPFMPSAERDDLKGRAAALPVRVRTSVSDSLSYIAAADVVVAMAGYNTTVEILRLGRPAVLVPRHGPSQEQRMRAGRFAELGWVVQVDPDGLESTRLATAVVHALETPRDQAVPSPDVNGLSRAVERLLGAETEPHPTSKVVARLMRRAGRRLNGPTGG
jgi:predicted glycosyltransferase